MIQLILIFVGVNALNILLNTVKSVLTVKGSIISAAVSSGITYYVYTYANIITVNSNDINIHYRALIIAALNIVFVGLALWIINKLRKDQLWKIEATFRGEMLNSVDNALAVHRIPHSYIRDIGKHCIFNIYCETQEQSKIVKHIISEYNGKYFAQETKNL